MPSFTCNACGLDVVYAAVDEGYFKNHLWECNICYSVIAKKRYPVNVAGGTTLFSPMSSGLGDIVFSQVVRQQYAEDNPDEDIVWLGMCEPEEAKAQYKPTKFFWCNVTNFIEHPSSGVIDFALETEATEYAKRDIYPRLWFEPVPVEGLPNKYIVFHVRNVKKAEFKNAEPMIVYRLTMAMDDMLQSGQIDGVVIVGNDQPLELEQLTPGFIDLRKKLSIEQIGFVLQHARGMVGKDSGIAHLAAAADCPVVAWGYRDARWTPKNEPGMVATLMKEQSNPVDVTELFKSEIGSRI